MLGLGNIGNIGGVIMIVLTLGVSAIVLLTFAPTVVGDVDGLATQGRTACAWNGERFSHVVTPTGTENADDAWADAGTTVTQGADDSGTCKFGTLAAKAFTPKGTEIPAASLTAGVLAGSKWKPASRAMTALAGGSLVPLLFGAMAILIPAGCLGFLGYLGAEMVQSSVGGGTLAVAIGATVSVVVIGAILPEIFEPLDTFVGILDGRRYLVYSTGIGQIAGVLSNFLGISIIGGLVALGALLWKGRSGAPGEMM